MLLRRSSAGVARRGAVWHAVLVGTCVSVVCMKTSVSAFCGRQVGIVVHPRNSAFAVSPKVSTRPAAATGPQDEERKDESLEGVPKEWREEVLGALSAVIDPDLNVDIVSLGLVQNVALVRSNRTVTFDVQLTTPACPVKEQFRHNCTAVLKAALPWLRHVSVTLTAPPPAAPSAAYAGLQNVRTIVAVSSCKGGVGKSTTAVNLAYTLQHTLRASVGILDADFYGPSLPTMITPDVDTVRFIGRLVAPLQRDGVKLMSFGYIHDDAAVMRGPMLTQLLQQFLSIVQWGTLDYLIIDMPPGTGDIPLTLCQELRIAAAVIVTTPQQLSFVDVERGIDMFTTVNVPCVAVVENMAYYQPPQPLVNTTRLQQAFSRKLQSHLGLSSELDDTLTDELVSLVVQHQPSSEKVPLFGLGHKHRLSTLYGIENTFSIPLLSQIATNGDSGTPYVLQFPDSPVAHIYRRLAAAVVREVEKNTYFSSASLRLTHLPDSNSIQITDSNDRRQPVVGRIPSAELRRDCKCASCVEEFTGKRLLRPSQIPAHVRPRSMKPCGNYAIAIDWSDDHKSLYPHKQLRSYLPTNNDNDNDPQTNDSKPFPSQQQQQAIANV